MAVALHVPGAWRERKNRVSGLVMAVALIGLVITGYLLYYAGGESARALASVAHWLPGLALPAVGLWHGWRRA
jgi:cytochrome b561